MKYYPLIIPLLGILLLASCRTVKYKSPYKQYAWHDFEVNYYQFVKDHTEDAKLDYEQSLTQILRKQNRGKTKRVPPGVYAEMGMITAKKGHADVAVIYFKREKELYPESSVLMDRLIERYEE